MNEQNKFATVTIKVNIKDAKTYYKKTNNLRPNDICMITRCLHVCEHVLFGVLARM